MTTARYAIIELEDGPPPANAIVVGDLQQILEFIPQSVARDAREQSLVERETKAAQIEEQQSQTGTAIQQILSDTLPRLLSHLDTVVSAREEQHRQDQEAKAQEEEQAETAAKAARIVDALKALPDADHSYYPSGDLHTLPPKDDTDNIGDLPPELLKEAPTPGPANYPEPTPADLGHPPPSKQFPQPIAVQFS
jgi:hypothetical protein